MVMRARHAVFHVDCFACVACDRRLSTGDEFQPSSIPTPSMFVNEDSWETSTMTSVDPTTSPPLSVRYVYTNVVSIIQIIIFVIKKEIPRSIFSQTTRVRTVLNEHQLSILKKCYALNSRPDALLKEQLVEMTALNARVIRVWFQNKRCKDKKRQIQMRDFAANAEKNTVQLFPSVVQVSVDLGYRDS
uniref:Homeobox domain-containing protein n=1 Tax=Heterorhabditis bacteriophora TaxID=37862 RepID=A0A1I7W8T9_HETBA